VIDRRARAINFALLTFSMLGIAIVAIGCSPASNEVAKDASWTIQVPVTTMPIPTTTTDPGTLPQTKQLPSTTDPLFQEHVADFWRGIVDDNPQEAMPFFFPLSAYIQVKGISDPVHDYDTRLIPAYEADIHRLHSELGSDPGSAQLVSLNVPQTQAEWILPGVEYNKGSYWRVFGNSLEFTSNGENRSFSVYSLISWRGEWYVVHVGPPTQ
jgi:hypothetical protein